jgi:hypothetical protein
MQQPTEFVVVPPSEFGDVTAIFIGGIVFVRDTGDPALNKFLAEALSTTARSREK